MKKLFWYRLLLICVILLLSACHMNDVSEKNEAFNNQNKKVYSRVDFALDTVVKLEIFSGGSEKILDDSIDIVKNLEHEMSYYDAEGELYRLNNAPAYTELSLSKDMYNVLKIADEIWEKSGGKLDIAIGSVTDTWRTYFDKRIPPNKDAITALLNSGGHQNIVLTNGYLLKKNEDVKLDLGAIGKGYAADLVYEYLKSVGVESAIINFGGNVLLLGSNDRKPYKIGVQDPFRNKNKYFAVLSVEDASVVTSGNYERFYEVDDKVYHHIIDPETGYPVTNNLASVTVVAKSSAYADALSTAFFSMGLSDGLKLANSLDNVDAYFVTKDKQVYCSSGAQSRISIVDNSYNIDEKR